MQKCAAAGIGSGVQSLTQQPAGGHLRRGRLRRAAGWGTAPRAAHVPTVQRRRSAPSAVAAAARYVWLGFWREKKAEAGRREESDAREGETEARPDRSRILGHWALLGHRGTRKEPRACLEFSSTYRVKSEKHPPKQRSQD